MSDSPFRDPLEILRELHGASGASFAALVQEFGFSLLPFEHVPAEAFNELLATLQSAELVANVDAWKLVNVLKMNWHLVSAGQQAGLRSVLVKAFGRFSDPTGAMLIAELLGENFCDEEALQQLTELSSQAPMPARALVPHGLRSLAQTTVDAALRQKAIARIKVLTKDPVSEVRKEAALALARCG